MAFTSADVTRSAPGLASATWSGSASPTLSGASAPERSRSPKPWTTLEVERRVELGIVELAVAIRAELERVARAHRESAGRNSGR